MKFKVIIKTKASENKILGFDKERKLYRIQIKAVPEKGQANKELIKFLSKEFGKKVRIVSGHTSNIKTLEM